MRIKKLVIAVSVAVAASAAFAAQQQANPMTFFVTSVGLGKGADLGGLAGADRHCQTLADAAGAGKHTWRAYLSTTGSPSVNARDRIGKGPWHNKNGDLIARDVADLHDGVNNINRLKGVNEKGGPVNGRADSPNMHDILTGSSPDGRAISGGGDTTCGNWTKSTGDGSAIVGHADRLGLSITPEARSWNSSHASKGCSQPNLVSTGGAGLLYCFAADTGAVQKASARTARAK